MSPDRRHLISPLIIRLGAQLLAVAFVVGVVQASLGNAELDGDSRGVSLRLGTNLAEVNDYSPQFPFVDLFLSSRPWITQCEVGADPGCTSANSFDTGEAGMIDLDNDGWVRSLPARAAVPVFTSVATVWDFPPSFRGGRYIVRYEGEGALEYQLGAIRESSASAPGRDVILLDPSKGPAVLRITATDPSGLGNYLRAIRVVAEKDENPATIELFSSSFISQLEPYQALRFMDWMRTNNSVVARWSQRADSSDARYATDRGVPAEVMIELANKTAKVPWFTLPHQADDQFVRSFAELTKTRLKKSLSVYVEYSNEVWNPAFAQGDWVEERGVAAFSGSQGSRFTKRINFYGRRSAEICGIWREVFGAESSRIVCVMGAQAANSWTAREALRCPLWEQSPCGAHGISALAIAPYLGDYLGQEENAQEVRRWTGDSDGGIVKLFDELSTGGVLLAGPVGGAVAESVRWIRDAQDVARQQGVALVTYEGGQHLVGVGVAQSDELLTTLFMRANRDPRIGSLYQRYLAEWKRESGGLFMHFSDISPYSQFGSWGALERVGQISSPKYDELRRFVGLRSERRRTARITVRSTGRGRVINKIIPIRCGSTCSGEVVRGTRIHLRATPGRGARLKSWSGSCRHTRSVCTVVMDRNRVVRARFIG